MDSNHHAKFHPCFLSGFWDTPVETEQQQQQQQEAEEEEDKPWKLTFLNKLRTDLAIFTIFGVNAFFWTYKLG